MRRPAPFLFGVLVATLVALLLQQFSTEVRPAEALSGTVWKCVGFDAGTDVRANVWVHNDGADDNILVRVRFLNAAGDTVSTTFQGPGLDQTVGFSVLGPSFETQINKVQAAKITADQKTIIVDAERVLLGDAATGQDHRQVTCAPSSAAPDSLRVRGE